MIKKIGVTFAILVVVALGLSRKAGFLPALLNGGLNSGFQKSHYAAANFCGEKGVTESVSEASEIQNKPAFFLMGCGGFLN